MFLPNVEKVVIPIGKFLNYSLCYDRDPNKATAFELALGYTKSNAVILVESIRRNVGKDEAILKENNGYGDIYEVRMNLKGENGKTANVMTCWIIENGTDYPRLTNAYVTNKKTRRWVKNET